MPSILYSDIFGLSLSISKKTTCFVNAFFQRHPQEVSALLVPSIQALMLRWIHRVLRKTSFTWKNISNIIKLQGCEKEKHSTKETSIPSMSWICAKQISGNGTCGRLVADAPVAFFQRSSRADHPSIAQTVSSTLELQRIRGRSTKVSDKPW